MEEKLGKDLSYDLGYDEEKKKVVMKLKLDSKGVDTELSVALDSEYFIDKLAEAIPGTLDDKILGMIKAAL